MTQPLGLYLGAEEEKRALIAALLDTTEAEGPYTLNTALLKQPTHYISITQSATDGPQGSAALRIGTVSKAKIQHSAVAYVIDGVEYELAAGEVAFTATTHDIADPDADGREAIYVLSVNAAGTVTITKGTTAALGAAVAPATPANQAKLGEVKVAHNGTAIFDASTDLLDAAHLTDTYTNEPPDQADVILELVAL